MNPFAQIADEQSDGSECRVPLLKRLLFVACGFGVALGPALWLYSLPAERRRPRGPGRPDRFRSLADALGYLRSSGLQGWELTALAQRLVASQMAYSRRNNWDTPARAFARGMGYCHQKTLALHWLLVRLGIKSTPVAATRCAFPATRVHNYAVPARVSGHCWLSAKIRGEVRPVCPEHPANLPGKVHFEVLSPQKEYRGVFRLAGHIGSIIANVARDNEAVRLSTGRAVTASAAQQEIRTDVSADALREDFTG